MQAPETTDINPEQEVEEVSYEAPAIVYEGSISTRAGTPIPDEDLFGD